MASKTTAAASLPPDLFDTTTLVSLASTVVILAVAYGTSKRVLSPNTPGSYRFLFIWHLFDAGIHFFLEGSFLYHCFFSWKSLDQISARQAQSAYPTPRGYLGHDDRIWGAQAGGNNPFAQLWMVYAKADKRWAGADTGVISLELLTVLVVGPLACLVCYDIAKKNPRSNIIMTIIATAEIYGGFMTFCPEWLTGNQWLDGSNFVYMWLYLVFFNMLWVFIPFYALYVSWGAFSAAFQAQSALSAKAASKKLK